MSATGVIVELSFTEVDIDQIKLVGRLKNIVAIPIIGCKQELRAPLLKTDCGNGQSINVIKAEIRQSFQTITPSEL